MKVSADRVIREVVGLRPYRDQGLAYLSLDEAGVMARLRADPRLLRLPLARHGNDVTVGPDEATWTAWVRPPGAS